MNFLRKKINLLNRKQKIDKRPYIFPKIFYGVFGGFRYNKDILKNTEPKSKGRKRNMKKKIMAAVMTAAMVAGLASTSTVFAAEDTLTVGF